MRLQLKLMREFLNRTPTTISDGKKLHRFQN
jgi:hypothetical protein